MAVNADKISFFGLFQARPEKARGWTSQDIADLYRIADQLRQFGFPVSLQTGLSDEDDPWAVFERDSTGEVVVHVARIDGELVIADVVRERTHRGRDFRSLADRLLAEAPLTLPRAEDRGNVVLHPRMVMIAFVAAAFVLSEFANPTAAEADGIEVDTDPADNTGTLPQAKTEQNLAASQFGPFDAVGKVAGREGVFAGVGATQATALAVGLYALSMHLVLDVAEDEAVEAPVGASLEQASLFDKATHAQATASLPFDIVLSSNEQQLNASQLVQDLSPPAEISVTSVANADADADADDNIISVPLVVAVSLPVQEAPALNAELVVLEHASVKQDISQASVLSQPAAVRAVSAVPAVPAVPAEAYATQGFNAAEAFNRVAASVIQMDQSWLPTLRFDGDVRGAIVVKASDSAWDILDGDGLISNSTTSSAETNVQSAASLVVAPLAHPNRYLLVSDLSQSVHLASDITNILVYAGGDVGVSGFTFGRDSIVFIEDFTALDWITSVDIVGADVVLVGHGGSLTLFGAIETFI